MRFTVKHLLQAIHFRSKLCILIARLASFTSLLGTLDSSICPNVKLGSKWVAMRPGSLAGKLGRCQSYMVVCYHTAHLLTPFVLIWNVSNGSSEIKQDVDFTSLWNPFLPPGRRDSKDSTAIIPRRSSEPNQAAFFLFLPVLSLLPYKANIIDGVHFRFVAAPQQCPTYIKLSLIFFVDHILFFFCRSQQETRHHHSFESQRSSQS
jgi:hypothetical protein